MIPTEKDRVQHIIDAVDQIILYVDHKEESNFMNDKMLSSAVLFQFLIIGEAILYIDNYKLSRYPYPWHLVRGFRNYIAHEYFGINLKLVWETIILDLPDLKILMTEILEKEY